MLTQSRQLACVGMFTAIAFASGCASRAVPVTTLPGLHENVGHGVRLQGRVDGPGKIADYIMIDGTPVYLFEKTEGVQHIYGSTVIAEGVLEYRTYERGLATGRARGVPQDHFRVSRATLRVVSSDAEAKRH